MTVEQFFAELEECLAGEVSAAELRDSISYYREYIRDEVRAGKTEEEVISSLGSPRLIARSIVDARGTHASHGGQAREEYGDYSDAGSYNSYDSDSSYDSGSYYDEETGKVYDSSRGPGTGLFDSEVFQVIKKWVIIVAVLLVAGTVLRVLLPVIIVILVVGFILRLFQN